MIIYLKNGVVIETQDELESITRNGLKEVIGIKWKKTTGKSLYYVDWSEVAAVVDDLPVDVKPPIDEGNIKS